MVVVDGWNTPFEYETNAWNPLLSCNCKMTAAEGGAVLNPGIVADMGDDIGAVALSLCSTSATTPSAIIMSAKIESTIAVRGRFITADFNIERVTSTHCTPA
jgi:methyl coenzyme M reductase subunit C